MASATPESEDAAECGLEELDDIITQPAGGMTMLPNTAYDEVYDNLLVGDESDAAPTAWVTHILNAAHGVDIHHVNTNEDMYRKLKVTFKGIEAIDHMSFNLYPFFQESADFIEKALDNGGKVLVHCIQGVSRSATLAVAFLMLKRHMTVKDALRLVRSHREVCPNTGFQQQLIKLDSQLRLQRHDKLQTE
ncbi:dual specificity protein phosphatase 3-like [Haliotis rubra]|uniref:dual specificity protein phosphatase 3-like n=1 Tax=Haliotis rubra TaxID=36100 RepID=UPI001EE5C39F|nr:dual specificity protein phosphatase 3-like [Haliotis rubra]